MWHIPANIVEILQEKGLSGDPASWEFKLQALSDDRAFLWFENNVGVLVLDNDWRLASMAEVAFTAEDKAVFKGYEIQATSAIEEIGGPLTLYIDGSIAWTDTNDVFHTANWNDGTTQEQMEYWIICLKKRETSWLTKAFQGDTSLNKLRTALEYWRNAFAEKQMEKIHF